MIGLTSRARVQHIKENPVPHNGLVLDVGCGSGELVDALQWDRFHVIGLDKDAQRLVALNAAMRRIGESCNLVAADVSSLPFRNSSFGAVYCMEVINMLDQDSNALTELARVLKRNGMCTLSVPYEQYPAIYDPINRLLAKMGLTHLQIGIWSPGVKRLYKPSELSSKLRSLGINPVTIHYIGRWLIPILENYLSLLLYYEIFSSHKNRPPSKRQEVNPSLFNAFSKVLDCIIKLDQVPNMYGTHFIIKAKKF
jgi:2-polyprenyl-3-methyl-5-hydroxy-6-metoxy-1,4-benzoquinol methylase